MALGALASFVAIALQHEGKLRSVAVEAIRVLSEDISPSRQTRLRLCEDGATKALGLALRDSVERLSMFLEGTNRFQVDCQVSILADPQKILIQSYWQTKESGGVESLLWVASLPFVSDNGLLNPDGTVMHLVEESCRSLAFLSPLLLSNDAASKDYIILDRPMMSYLFCIAC